MRGSYSVEAAIALTVITALVLLLRGYYYRIRAEITVQNALDKTAAEIASLTYPAARVVESLTSADLDDAGDNQTSSFLGQLAAGIGIGGDLPSFESVFKEFKGNIESVATGGADAADAAKKLYSSVKEIADDPKGAAALLASGVLSDLSLDVAGRIIAAPLCRMIIPAYIDPDDPDGALKKLGVPGGLDGIDFSLSDVLFNGKDITVAAVYEIEQPDIGIPLPSVKIVQRAVAAAWVPDSLLNLKESSIWDLSPFERGREIVKIYKSTNPGLSVKSGYGFSLYSSAAARYTLITSVNVYSSYYSDCFGKDGGGYSYRLREANLKKEIAGRAASLKKGFGKLSEGSAIKLENGMTEKAVKRNATLYMIVVFPEEASEFRDRIEAVCAAVAAERGVKIEVEYRDKALRNNNEH